MNFTTTEFVPTELSAIFSMLLWAFLSSECVDSRAQSKSNLFHTIIGFKYYHARV